MQPPIPRAEAATFIRRPLVHLSADANRCAIFCSIPTEISWPLHRISTPLTNTYTSISSAPRLSLPPQRYGGALQIRLFPRQFRLLRFIHYTPSLYVKKLSFSTLYEEVAKTACPKLSVMALFWIRLSLYIFPFLRTVIAASGNCDVAPLSLPWSNVTVSTNGVAVARGLELGIGSPNQIFSLRPSTTLNNTRLSNVLDCGSEANTSCVGGKGGVYGSSKSSTCSVSIKDRWNGSAADTETATGSYVYLHDFIDFQSNDSIWGFPLVEDSDLVSGRSLKSAQPNYARIMGLCVLGYITGYSKTGVIHSELRVG